MKGFSIFLAALCMSALLVDGRLAKSGSKKNDRSIHAPSDAICLVNGKETKQADKVPSCIPSFFALIFTFVHKDDFAKGTLIINTPGTYKLCEDIVFDPIQSMELPITEMYLVRKV